MLVHLAEEHTRAIGERDELNTNLVEIIQPYVEGQTVGDVGRVQPTAESVNTVLPMTVDETDKGSPKINGIRCSDPEEIAPGSYKVTVEIRPKYKPEHPEKHETDCHGYLVEEEQEFILTLKFTNLDEETALLLSEFLPQAYENKDLRSKSNMKRDANTCDSLIDRVKKMNLPDTDQSHVDMDLFVENKRLESEYNHKAEKLDVVTDRIVSPLYGNPLN